MAQCKFRIEPATETDVPIILQCIRGLAKYEHLEHEVTATEADVLESLFGASPAAEAFIAYDGKEPVGFAVFFHTYSTFLAQRGLYLEDLFVFPRFRGQGAGRQLLVHVAGIAIERECGRLEWSVLNWNEKAIGFYKQLEAKAMHEWTMYRLTGSALQRLADADLA